MEAAPRRRAVEVRLLLPETDTPASQEAEHILSGIGGRMDLDLVVVRPKTEEARKSLGLNAPVAEPLIRVPSARGSLCVKGVGGARQVRALLEATGRKNR